MMKFPRIAVALGLALSGCGFAYVSSDIREMSGTDGVQVVDLTPATVSHANARPYQPQSLPEAYSRIAGGNRPPTGPRLPDPVFGPENVPGSLEVRLPPETDPEPYRIGVGDILRLSTPEAAGLAGEMTGGNAAQIAQQGFTVQDDGAISIPDVGRVAVAGLSLQDAENAIFSRMVEARMDPSFSVEIAEFNARRVAIGGAVASPGLVPITLAPLHLDQLLAASGGVTTDEFAVVRIFRDGSLYQVPVDQLFAASGLRRILLQDGDSVFVDTTYDYDRAEAFYNQEIARADYTQQQRANAISELQAEISIRRAALQESRSNFESRVEFGAVGREYVYIAGEVDSPGRFPLPFDNRVTLADALFEQGGVAETSGDPSQIYVLRADSSPSYVRDIIAYRLDARNAANFVLAARMELRPGDVIFISEQPVTRWNRTISQILPTITLSDRLARN